ncbi:hypothetical protein [Brevundimonas sp. 357]|uniref:hypothetical protein n=1 Tax=Brevundimonas sp. 357 TaxID=2555782 RepID=UPI00140552E0|nr:hypothetical protein [Brevundimonas sp. 357]
MQSAVAAAPTYSFDANFIGAHPRKSITFLPHILKARNKFEASKILICMPFSLFSSALANKIMSKVCLDCGAPSPLSLWTH